MHREYEILQLTLSPLHNRRSRANEPTIYNVHTQTHTRLEISSFLAGQAIKA